MPSIYPFVPPMELLRAQTKHDPFPFSISQGMLAAEGASSQSVDELDDFIRRFFVLDMPGNFFIQMAIAGAWICVLFIVGNTCVLHRIRKRAFWLFKFQKRSEGTYVVPNALNSFLFFEGFFAVIWLAYIVVNYEAYWKENAEMQYHLGVFSLIIWWPLYLGAFMAGWGSFYTAPGALEKGPISSSRVGSLGSRPLFINICCLGTPIILIASLLAPIILNQRHYTNAFNAYQSLHADMMDAVAASPDNILPLSTAWIYLERASMVWQMQTVSVWYGAIGFAVWSVWAGILLLFYIPAGGYLCYLLLKQVRAQKAVLKNLEVQKREIEQMEREKEKQRPPVLLFAPLSTKPDHQDDATSSVQFSTPVIANSGFPFPADKEGEDKDSEDSGPDFFFPPLSPEIKRQATKHISVKGSPQRRYKYLRRCFINLTVLYIGIVLGASLYLGVAASLARSYYESYLNNPNDCMQLVYTAMVVTAWGAVLFGTLTIFAILARFADPANASSQDDNVAKRPRPSHLPRFLQHSASDKTLVDSMIRQEKARASTAIQESGILDVATVLDDAMQSKDKSEKGFKFQLRKKSDAIIMQPVGASSSHTPGETTSVDMTEHIRSDMSRRVPSFVPEDMTQGSVYEEESQIVSRFRAGSLIQPTPHGDMPCPDPEFKPLVPERPPPLSPIILEPRQAPSPPPLAPPPRRRDSSYAGPSPLTRLVALPEVIVSSDTAPAAPSNPSTASDILTWNFPDVSPPARQTTLSTTEEVSIHGIRRPRNASVSVGSSMPLSTRSRLRSSTISVASSEVGYIAPTDLSTERRISPGVFF